MSVEWLLSNP